jgi:hypothetical protein
MPVHAYAYMCLSTYMHVPYAEEKRGKAQKRAFQDCLCWSVCVCVCVCVSTTDTDLGCVYVHAYACLTAHACICAFAYKYIMEQVHNRVR